MLIHTESADWDKHLANVNFLMYVQAIRHVQNYCIQSAGLTYCAPTQISADRCNPPDFVLLQLCIPLPCLILDPTCHVTVMVMFLMCRVGIHPGFKKTTRTIIGFHTLWLVFVLSSKIVKNCIGMVKGTITSGKQLNN